MRSLGVWGLTAPMWGAQGFGPLAPAPRVHSSQRSHRALCMNSDTFVSNPQPDKPEKCPVLICPAQLSVAEDYEEMIAEFNARGYTAYAPKLTRGGWITGLIPSALSLAYWQGVLEPAKTLKFYYEAVEEAFEEIKRNHPGSKVHVVGHSIGGWVARAWLGGSVSDKDLQLILSLTTLGTPNMPPPELGLWSKIDQTRGLLKFINREYPGAYRPGVKYTCVIGTGVQGKLSLDLEEFVAYITYLPLSGEGGTVGDGIIPINIAFIDGAEQIVIPDIKHAGFIPTPGKSIKLKNYPWYGDPHAMDVWIKALESAESAKGLSLATAPKASKA